MQYSIRNTQEITLAHSAWESGPDQQSILVRTLRLNRSNSPFCLFWSKAMLSLIQ